MDPLPVSFHAQAPCKTRKAFTHSDSKSNKAGLRSQVIRSGLRNLDILSGAKRMNAMTLRKQNIKTELYRNL